MQNFIVTLMLVHESSKKKLPIKTYNISTEHNDTAIKLPAKRQV